MTLRDLFEGTETEFDFKLGYSAARISEQALLAFEFNSAIDVRKLKLALVDLVRAKVDDLGHEYEERDLRRAVDLAVMREPDPLKTAIQNAQARQVRALADVPIPDLYFGPRGLKPACL